MTDCLPQEMYSIYVDGELTGSELRSVETHLVGCEKCRGLTLALRDEGTAIADVVLDRHREVVIRAPARARAKGLAIGFVPTLGIAVLVIAVWGWLAEIGLPFGVSWFNPMNSVGGVEMMFDSVLMLRDVAPALFEFAIAAGAMLSVAAILTFLVSAVGKRVVGPLLILACVLGSMLGTAESVSAFEQRFVEGDTGVAADETIDESLIIAGDRVTVDGTVNGDLAVAGERVILRGVVRGNVYAAGREVEVFGTIEGALHAAGSRVMIEGKVGGSVLAAGKTVILHERGSFGRDASLFGESIQVDGSTARDLFAAAERIEVRGSVGRDLTTKSERLILHDSASVRGDLDYGIGWDEAAEIGSGVQIGGETRSGTLEHRMGEPDNRWLDGHFYMRVAVFLGSAFLVGMLLYWLFPGLFENELETSGDFFRSLGYGAVGAIGIPVALVLCLITVVGIPIGIIGFFLYLTTLFVSVIVVASLLGVAATATLGFEREDAYGFGISLLAGLVLLTLGMSVPYLGGIFRFLVVVIGFGMLIDAAIDYWRDRESGEDSYAL